MLGLHSFGDWVAAITILGSAVAWAIRITWLISQTLAKQEERLAIAEQRIAGGDRRHAQVRKAVIVHREKLKTLDARLAHVEGST